MKLSPLRSWLACWITSGRGRTHDRDMGDGIRGSRKCFLEDGFETVLRIRGYHSPDFALWERIE